MLMKSLCGGCTSSTYYLQLMKIASLPNYVLIHAMPFLWGGRPQAMAALRGVRARRAERRVGALRGAGTPGEPGTPASESGGPLIAV